MNRPRQLISIVTMIVHDITGSPVSGFFHLSHRPAKLITLASAALTEFVDQLETDPQSIASDLIGHISRDQTSA